MHERMPSILGTAMGDDAFVTRFKTKKEVDEFLRFILEKAE